MRILSGLVFVTLLYFGFGQPGMASTFLQELAVADIRHQKCSVSHETCVIRVPSEAEWQRVKQRQSGAFQDLRHFTRLAVSAARSTIAKTFAADRSNARPFRGHRPTYFLPDHGAGEAFTHLSLSR